MTRCNNSLLAFESTNVICKRLLLRVPRYCQDIPCLIIRIYYIKFCTDAAFNISKKLSETVQWQETHGDSSSATISILVFKDIYIFDYHKADTQLIRWFQHSIYVCVLVLASEPAQSLFADPWRLLWLASHQNLHLLHERRLDGAQMERVLSEERHVTNQDWARLPASQTIFCWFKRPLRLHGNGKPWWGHQRKSRNIVANIALVYVQHNKQ